MSEPEPKTAKEEAEEASGPATKAEEKAESARDAEGADAGPGEAEPSDITEKEPTPEEKEAAAEKAAVAWETDFDIVQRVMQEQSKPVPFKERLAGFSRFQRQLFLPEHREVAKKFFWATTAMLLLPVTSFYIAEDVLTSYGVDKRSVGTYAAIAAGVMVQVVSFGYVYVAILEERAMKQKKE
ncbi:hypothetical protein DIPPA_06419 [Diplonema papillatum]|nr:hypothetical protein DIPPA_06419 [Diplonema papillatum]|eukprot:gene22547-34501_t